MFYFSRIPHSNLLLVVIGPTNQNYPKIVLGAEPQRINYTFLGSDTFPCHKKYLNKLGRRRLDDCFTEDCRVCIQLVQIYFYLFFFSSSYFVFIRCLSAMCGCGSSEPEQLQMFKATFMYDATTVGPPN